MLRIWTRGRWLRTIALAAFVAVFGLWLAWAQRSGHSVTRGWVAYERGEWEMAAGLARMGLKMKANDVDSLRLLARASVRMGRDDSATVLFHRLGPQAMLADDLCLLGISLTRTGDRQGALRVWEQARSLDPNHAETLFELTRAYFAVDRPIAAAETGRRLAARPGWESRAEALLGAIELSLNDPAGAVASWRRALEHITERQGGDSPPPVPGKDIARALLQAGQPVEARYELQSLLVKRPDREGAWLLSRAYLQEQAMPEALAIWKQVGSFRDDNPLLPEPARFIGSEACAGCHRATFHSQQRSRHARTFLRGSELSTLELPASTITDPGQSIASHTLRKIGGDRLQQETRVEGQTFRAIVDYAFGSGDRGLTLVGHEDDGQARELRLSQYPDGAGSIWDVTAGHTHRAPVLAEYLGQSLSEDSVRRCLFCHVTDASAVLKGSGPGASDHGIGCEKCHGPGGNHLLAVAAKFPDLAIARPSMASGAPIVILCAQCHSPLGRTISPDDPTSVRFQGTSLTWSRCFTESNNTFDCVTCHDPHRNADKSIDHYESKCLSCHASSAHAVATSNPGRKAGLAATPKRTSCPVNPTRGCIGCHMPAVKDVVPHSTFTDHFIRVHRD